MAAWSGEGVPAEAGEAGVHVGPDEAGVEASLSELEDEAEVVRQVERELAPISNETGATADGAAPADEDPEAGPRGADFEEAVREPGPDRGEEVVELGCPRREVRGGGGEEWASGGRHQQVGHLAR
jgi:hypothetical protein